MTIPATAVALAMASILLWAGLEKARALPSVASALAQLGVPQKRVSAAAVSLIAAELAVALGLIFRPGSAATLVGVLGLAVAFAGAGLIAMVRHRRIRCSCFGSSGGAALGKRQLLALPLWIAGAAVLRLQPPPPWQGEVSLAVVGLSLAALRGISTWRAALAARGDRGSTQEMLVWLPR